MLNGLTVLSFYHLFLPIDDIDAFRQLVLILTYILPGQVIDAVVNTLTTILINCLDAARTAKGNVHSSHIS